jgi:hypothetical protein
LKNQQLEFLDRHVPNKVEFIAVISLATLVFLYICGWQTLDATNLAFLQSGDRAQHYLGWAFYRASDLTMPIGLNPNFGLENSSSIVFSDSIPLIAIPLKLLSEFLSKPFQYFGSYIYLIFILQSYFSWLLAKIIIKEPDVASAIIRLSTVGLFIFSPTLLSRISEHIALSSHFLILAGIYLSLITSTRHKFGKWLLLLSIAILIHFYLFTMVFLLYLASLLDRQSSGNRTYWTTFFLEISAVVTVIGLLAWQAGYFVERSVLNTKWYGIGNLNLMALFDSNGWSYVIPNISQSMGNLNSTHLPGRVFEGFNYFGLGFLLLSLLAIPGLKALKDSRKYFFEHKCLALSLLLMTMFAITNQISIGPYNFSFFLPENILKYAELLRTSARFFWPMFYILALLIIYINVFYYQRKLAALIIFCAFLIQAIDLTPGIQELRNVYSGHKISIMNTNLSGPFWEQAALRYKKILAVQPSMSWDYQNVAAFAVNNGLSTNDVYLARPNPDRLELAQQEWANQVLGVGALNSETLYLIDDQLKFLVATRPIKDKDFLFAEIDGRNVLAPKWLATTNKPDPQIKPITVKPVQLSYGDQIHFSQNSFGKSLLAYGWADPEGWGVWSDSKNSLIFIPVNPTQSQFIKTIEVEAIPFLDDHHPTQRIDVRVNDGPIQSFDLNKHDQNYFSIRIDQSVTNQDFIKIDFHFPNARRATVLNFDADSRLLAVGLIRATLKK